MTMMMMMMMVVMIRVVHPIHDPLVVPVPIMDKWSLEETAMATARLAPLYYLVAGVMAAAVPGEHWA